MDKLRRTTVSRFTLVKIFLITLCFLSLTFLRPALIFCYPLLVTYFILVFEVKFPWTTLKIVLGIFLCTAISASYISEFNFGNYILSFLFIFPLIFVLMSKIKQNNIYSDAYIEYLIKIITYFLIANNVIGFIQLAMDLKSDDAFIGFYGRHGMGMHTLSIINFLMAAYYLFDYQAHFKKKDGMLFLFFFLAGICCFYGLGLLILIFTIFVFRLSYKKLLKSIFIFTIGLVSFGGFLYVLKPANFSYNMKNIRMFQLIMSNDLDERLVVLIPRKLLLFKNYYSVYANDPVLFLLGTGPGTFNSRSSFLLNGDYSKSGLFENIFGCHTPHLAKKYVYSLWNSTNTKQNEHMDGTRNEPFSSLIAMLSEYGFIITFFLSTIIYKKHSEILRRLKKIRSDSRYTKKSYLYCNFFKFASLFILINLIFNNFLEYPEIIFIYVIIFKLIEMASQRMYDATKTSQMIQLLNSKNE
jgi:hypothetical protein